MGQITPMSPYPMFQDAGGLTYVFLCPPSEWWPADSSLQNSISHMYGLCAPSSLDVFLQWRPRCWSSHGECTV